MSIIDDKWKLLFDRYDIEKKVSESGPFYITADQIREYKEPRLMTKFDTRESLPSVFGSRLGLSLIHIYIKDYAEKLAGIIMK